MYSGASTFVEGVDTAFVVILGISAFFLIGITAALIYFIVRYNKKRNPKSAYIEGSVKLEVIWTVVPTILVLVMFFYGWAGFSPMRNVPDDAMEVNTIARMWSFAFEYDNGERSDTLFVPIDKAVKLNLISEDVIHSLYIPAFRVKEDIVPGKKNYMWFEAKKIGEYELFCAEYCGMRHSYMTTAVKVMSQEDYDAWLEKTAQPLDSTAIAEFTPQQLNGKKVLEDQGCIACHSLDGSKIVGPTFIGLYGKKEKVSRNGILSDIVVDDEYIKESIYNPNDDITEGYTKGLMQSYTDKVSEEEVSDIIEYLKTLKE